MKHLILGAIVLKGLGSLLFVFGSTLGALLLVCILLCVIFLLDLHCIVAFVGFFFGKLFCLNLFVSYLTYPYLCLFTQLIHQAVASPVLYDFYNYDVDKKEFVQLFFKFSQVSHWFALQTLRSSGIRICNVLIKSTSLHSFEQNLALLGALLFFIGMKNSMPRRSSSSSSKKKGPKAKAN